MTSKIPIRSLAVLWMFLSVACDMMAFPVVALAQDKPKAFYLLRKAGSLLYVPPVTVVERTKVNEEALDFARQALKQPFDSPRLPSFDVWNDMAHDSETVAYEFVRESQLMAEQKDWLGAINARLDAVELAVKLEAVSDSYGNVVYESSVEAVAIKNIYDLAVHLDDASSQLVIARINAIEAQRPELLSLLEKSKLRDLHYSEEKFKNTDWKNSLVQASGYTMTSPDQGEMFVYGFTLADLEDVTPEMLQNQISRLWDVEIEKERQGYPMKRPLPGFKPNPAMSVLFSYPGESYRIGSVMTRTQWLLLSCALQLKAVHQKTGVYPSAFKTPPDPFGNGKLLIYWPIGKTYRLYSVGPDGVDDGRTTPLSRFQARWPGDVSAPLLEAETGAAMN